MQNSSNTQTNNSLYNTILSYCNSTFFQTRSKIYPEKCKNSRKENTTISADTPIYRYNYSVYDDIESETKIEPDYDSSHILNNMHSE